MNSLLTQQEINITSKKEMEELGLTEQEVCKSILVFSHAARKHYEYFYDLKDAIESAKEEFIEEYGADAKPGQVNFDRFVVIKDGEEFAFDFCKFEKESGKITVNALTYASDEEAVKIFDGEIKADLTFLTDTDISKEEI